MRDYCCSATDVNLSASFGIQILISRWRFYFERLILLGYKYIYLYDKLFEAKAMNGYYSENVTKDIRVQLKSNSISCYIQWSHEFKLQYINLSTFAMISNSYSFGVPVINQILGSALRMYNSYAKIYRVNKKR